MKCLKCKCKNSYKSNYCYECGERFTDEEKKKSSNNKFVKFLKFIRDIYDRLNLDNITGNIYFRIFSVIVVVLIGLYGIITNGFHLRIETSSDYTYQYNKKDDEYYLYTDNETTKLNLYTLGENSSITVSYYDENGSMINENNYTDYNDIILTANTFSNNYYILTHKKDKLKLYIYKN